MIPINWNPEKKELKKFGFWMLILCSILSLIFLLKGHDLIAFVIFCFGGVSGGLSMLGLSASMPFYWLWMGLSMALGFIVAPIIFFLIFYFLITPYSLFLRSIGRDRLNLKKGDSLSYWIDVHKRKDKKQYLRQF